MRNLKKVLALVIAFSMMLSVVAFASYNDVAADAEYAGAVELLSALEIIKGDDLGNFNPDNTITRAEMAAIVCRAKGLESAANGAKGFTAFNDVAADHWASGYVNLASQNGIINGYGDGNFGPEDTVTYEQAVKMLVCALGFEPMAATKGGFPTGYLVVANTYGVTEGVTASVEAPRKTVAQLVYNALSTPMMDQTAFGADAEYEIFDGKKNRDYKTLLTEMDIYIATGIVGAKEVDEINFMVMEASDDLEFVVEKDSDGNETFNETFNINGTNIADYQFQNVDVYVKKDARKDYYVLAVVGSAVGETFSLLSDDVKDVIYNDAEKKDKIVKVEYYVDPANSSKTKEIKVDIKQLAVNKSLDDAPTVSKIKDYVLGTDVELVFVENTGDTTYDVLVATKYTSALVDYVDADKDKIQIDGRTITFDFEDEDKDIILVDDAGNELTLADFAEDDVVAVVYSGTSIKDFGDYIKVVKLSNAVVTGTVDEAHSSNNEDYVVIDGTEYKVDESKGLGLAVGDEGSFYIGMTGKVIYFDGSAASKNYAYVIEAAISSSAFSSDKWQVKLLTEADGIVTYDLTDDANDAFVSYLDTNTDLDVDGKDNDDDEQWLFEGATDKGAAYRIVTYKTNAKGEIKSIAVADGSSVATSKTDIYNDRTQIIKGKTLEDDVVIFNVTGTKADDAYVTDISYLVDDSGYEGRVFSDVDGEACVMVVTAEDSVFAEEAGFAIVTKISTGKDANDEDVTKVSYVMDEVEGVAIFDGDEETADVKEGTDVPYTVDDLTVGSVFMFNANAEGVVSKYIVLGVMNNGAIVPSKTAGKVIVTSKEENEDVEIISGYIFNAKRAATSKGETLTLKDAEGKERVISVSKDSNKYTYNTAGRNVVIETEDFMAHDDMDYATINYKADEKGNLVTDDKGNYIEVSRDAASFVFVKMLDGAVVDIYGMAAEKKFDTEAK